MPIDSGSIEIPATLESAIRCIPRSGLVQRLIFRVPEYSELSIHTGVRSRSDQEGWVTKLGIFLLANLAAAVEVVDD